MITYGIDLGTTYCAVSQMNSARGRDPAAVLFDEGGAFPSLVLLAPGPRGPRAVVGARARREYANLVGRRADPPPGVHLIRGAKNHIGRTATGQDGGPPWVVGDVEFTATDVSALILRALRKRVEAQGLASMQRVVVTHPQKFRNLQRLATQQAAQLAGLEVVAMLTEPDAAACAYEHSRPSPEAQRSLVFDFGGGTLDVTLMRVEPAANGRPNLRAVDSYGIQLGGLAMDERIRDALAQQYADKAGDPGFRLDLVNESTRERLLELSEWFKVALNTDAGSDPSPLARTRSKRFTPVLDEETEGEEVTLTLSLGDLSRVLGSDIDRAMSCADEALNRASLRWSDLDEVLLTGGSSLLWPLQQRMRERVARVRIFDDPRHPLNPLTVVASGAALYGAALGGDAPAVSMRGVVPDTFSIRAYTPDASAPDGRRATLHPLIPAGTPTPFVGRAQFVMRGGGRTLPVEVFEGRSEREATRVGVYAVSFEQDIPDGARVDVTLDVRANGALVLGVQDARGGALREAPLDDAPGLYSDAELDLRARWLQALRVEWKG